MISGVPMLIYMYFMPQFEYSFGGTSERISFIKEKKTSTSQTPQISSGYNSGKVIQVFKFSSIFIISWFHGNKQRQANDIPTLLTHILFNLEEEKKITLKTQF